MKPIIKHNLWLISFGVFAWFCAYYVNSTWYRAEYEKYAAAGIFVNMPYRPWLEYSSSCLIFLIGVVLNRNAFNQRFLPLRILTILFTGILVAGSSAIIGFATIYLMYFGNTYMNTTM
jgi:hypothetical protein